MIVQDVSKLAEFLW